MGNLKGNASSKLHLVYKSWSYGKYGYFISALTIFDRPPKLYFRMTMTYSIQHEARIPTESPQYFLEHRLLRLPYLLTFKYVILSDSLHGYLEHVDELRHLLNKRLGLKLKRCGPGMYVPMDLSTVQLTSSSFKQDCTTPTMEPEVVRRPEQLREDHDRI
jgi:hypothetical protein